MSEEVTKGKIRMDWFQQKQGDHDDMMILEDLEDICSCSCGGSRSAYCKSTQHKTKLDPSQEVSPLQMIHKKYSQGVSAKHPNAEHIIQGAQAGQPHTLDNVENSILKMGDGSLSNKIMQEHHGLPHGNFSNGAALESIGAMNLSSNVQSRKDNQQ